VKSIKNFGIGIKDILDPKEKRDELEEAFSGITANTGKTVVLQLD
jgi:hypothetical protein